MDDKFIDAADFRLRLPPLVPCFTRAEKSLPVADSLRVLVFIWSILFCCRWLIDGL
jgi:hypothetical protein